MFAELYMYVINAVSFQIYQINSNYGSDVKQYAHSPHFYKETGARRSIICRYHRSNMQNETFDQVYKKNVVLCLSGVIDVSSPLLVFTTIKLFTADDFKRD